MSEGIKYYFQDKDGKTVGSVTEKELIERHLDARTKIWHRGLSSWVEYGVIFPENRIKPSSHRTLLLVSILLIIVICCALSFYLYKGNIYDKLVECSHSSKVFDLYIEKYYRDLEFWGISVRKAKEINIKFAKLEFFEDTKDCYGICFGGNNDDVIEIYINEDAWNNRLNKAQKYHLMYHELSHDILNVEDLPENQANKKSLMYPHMNRFEHLTMDDFIEMSHAFFEEQALQRN